MLRKERRKEEGFGENRGESDVQGKVSHATDGTESSWRVGCTRHPPELIDTGTSVPQTHGDSQRWTCT